DSDLLVQASFSFANGAHSQGNHDAVQDDHVGTPPATSGDSRPAPPETDIASDGEILCQAVEDPSRSLDGLLLPVEPGQRPEPDSERSPGNRSQGDRELLG